MNIQPINKAAPDDDFLGQAIQEVKGVPKIRTIDCVQAIMADPQFNTTNPKDWKRKSKRKDPAGAWIRLFINKATGQEVEVLEVTGGLQTQPAAGTPPPTGAPSNSGPESTMYYSATLITSENVEDLGMGDPTFIGWYNVWVTPGSYWNSNHHCIDHVTPEMAAELEALNFPPEDMESMYTLTPEQMQTVIASPNWYAHPEFITFMGGSFDSP